MEKFIFDLKPQKELYVNWTVNGLVFYRDCLRALGYPRRVIVGIDCEGKKLAVRAAARTKGEISAYDFVTDERRKFRVTLWASELREAVGKLLGSAPPRGGVKFAAALDETENLLIVDLKKPWRSGISTGRRNEK